jgi:hypothetical protein
MGSGEHPGHYNIHRPHRAFVIVVLQDPAGAPGHVSGDFVEEHVFEEPRGLRVSVGAPPVDLALEPGNDVGRQADVAVADLAVAQIHVLVRDRERGEIVELRRIVEPADLQDVRSLLEAPDVAIGVHELFLRGVNAHAASDAHLARRGGRQRVLRGSSTFELRELSRGKLQIANEQLSQIGLEIGGGARGVRQHRARTAERDDEETEALCRLTSYRSRRVRRSARPCRTSP